jgi:hypothetical protein
MATDHRSELPAGPATDAEVIDLEVVESGAPDGADGSSAADFAKQLQMAPDLLVRAFREMLKEKFRRWFFRSLIWGGVLGLLATEHTWAQWAFAIWLFIAGAHLAFLVYGWYASGRQGEKLARVFSGMMPPQGPP